MSKHVENPWAPGGTKWKKMMAKVYGIGGAVVILGALFKITHWPFSTEILTAGLLTEAVIFLLSAFEPIHEDPKWELVYPELAQDEFTEIDGEVTSSARRGKGSDDPVAQQLDAMLKEANIGPELIDSLGNGLRSLSTQAQGLSEITDAAAATNEYSSSLKTASVKVGELTETYTMASNSLTGLMDGQAMGQTAGEELQKMTTNLSQLNNMYEVQLNELHTTSQLFGGINELVTNLNSSIEDTKRYKEEIATLSQNLQSLNTVYGNMLSAMNFNRS
ncbi:MAG: type IX secretion system motor protein PorL/GldL [Luteibaculaceae bacterium]